MQAAAARNACRILGKQPSQTAKQGQAIAGAGSSAAWLSVCQPDQRQDLHCRHPPLHRQRNSHEHDQTRA